MWIGYMDESGNTGRKLDDPNQPIHLIAAVLVPEDVVQAVHRDVEEIKSQYDIWKPGDELRASELFGGDGPWKGVAPNTRVEVYRATLGLLEKHGLLVAHASVNKVSLAQQYVSPYSPHQVALKFLVEKLDVFLTTQSDPMRKHALLVADENAEHESFALDMIAKMQRDGNGLLPGRTVTKIIDTIHFVRSETNPGVQIADLVAYAIRRNLQFGVGKGLQSTAVIGEFASTIMRNTCTYRVLWPDDKEPA